MSIKNSIFVEEKEEFTWDETTLKTFKNVIKDQGIKCRMDDIFLLGFLRARKFDLQRSLELLKNYYSIRMNYPQYFKDLLPSKLEHVLSMNCMQFLPQPDQKGRYVIIMEMKQWDTSVFNVIDLFRAVLLHTDLQLNYHRTQVNSIVIIANAEGLSLSHFLQCSPSVLNTVTSILLRDSYQLRYKEIHYVNMNIIIKALLTVFVPLLPNKLKKRLHFHSDMTTLHEFVSPECLPSEYGGKLSSFDPTESNNMIRANEEFFRKNEEYLKIYEEELNRNFTYGKFRYIGEDQDEKLKSFIEKSEEKFNHYSQDPEGFMASLQEDSECEITHF